MGLSFQDDMDIAFAWKAMMQEVYTAVQKAGGWAWPMTGGLGLENATCATGMRDWCQGHPNGVMNVMFKTGGRGGPSNLTQPLHDLAAFLIVRGDYACVGYN